MEHYVFVFHINILIFVNHLNELHQVDNDLHNHEVHKEMLNIIQDLIDNVLLLVMTYQHVQVQNVDQDQKLFSNQFRLNKILTKIKNKIFFVFVI